MTWLEIIIDIMTTLGGHARYKDLYDKILELYPEKASSYKDFKSCVRAAIETNSSDSNLFRGKNDIFYLVEDKKSGHWGLRNFTSYEIDFNNENFYSIEEEEDIYLEGNEKIIEHRTRERNNKIAKLAKEKYKAKYGNLNCQVCGFNFEEKYGEIGKDFIEAHHIVPLSELDFEQNTTVDDFILLCSNCHKMIHRKKPWLSVDELKKLLKK